MISDNPPHASLSPDADAPDAFPPDADAAASYDYALPPELIAHSPPADRTAARLLVVDRNTAALRHQTIRDLPELLRSGDALVLNDTRVVPARLRGVREATGGKWEGLFLRITPAGTWELLGQTRGRLRDGETVVIPAPDAQRSPLRLRLLSREDGGIWQAVPDSPQPELNTAQAVFELLEQYGEVPLPPYIRGGLAGAADRQRYQTVYAQQPGSVAAPTAGLHFTPELLNDCRNRGVQVETVTLHVGIGTFRPMTAPRLSEHTMHAEYGELSAETAARLRHVQAAGGRVVAVGTTSVRVLETAAQLGELAAFAGETSLFIRPPYQFKAVDALLTNFHLPRSTLLVLVSTFAGRELIQRAYAEAIAQRYRFFSYGDAMLIV